MNFFNRDETENAVNSAESALEAAKNELLKAKTVRTNSLQYHALAQLINEHPEREPTAKKLDQLNTSLDKLKVGYRISYLFKILIYKAVTRLSNIMFVRAEIPNTLKNT